MLLKCVSPVTPDCWVRGDAFDLYSYAEEIRSGIPLLIHPTADPAGAKPRRDHRFLDRVSRHEVPKTPGNDDAFKVYDPARVSH